MSYTKMVIEIPITEKLEVTESKSLDGMNNMSSFKELERFDSNIANKLFNIIKKESIDFNLPYIIISYKGCKAWLTKEEYEYRIRNTN